MGAGAPMLESSMDQADRAAEASQRIRQALGGLEIVCFANDWRGDPTSKHHIMRTYAAHADVLWVESSGMRRPTLGLGDLKRIGGKLARSREGTVRSDEGVRVTSPLSIPLPGSRAAELVNRRLYRRSLARQTRGETDRPLLWVYTPTVAPYIRGMPRAGLVYHCVDRWWEFEEYDADVMMRNHVELCREADVVFASSAELMKDCEPHSGNVHLIRHGVEWRHFAAAALDELPEPPELAGIDGPVVGFFGLIHDWIDLELIERVARELPQATVVLIGKTRVDVGRLAKLPNVVLTGQQPYERLPAFARRFDVGLIPFRVNELTLAVNPIKLREYLSAGLRVVSTALPELLVYQDEPRVAIAADGDAFVAGVRAALESGDSAVDRREAALAMADESWSGRCARMAELWRDSVRPRG